MGKDLRARLEGCGGAGPCQEPSWPGKLSLNEFQITVWFFMICLFLLKSKSEGITSSYLHFFLGCLDGRYMAVSPVPWWEPCWGTQSLASQVCAGGVPALLSGGTAVGIQACSPPSRSWMPCSPKRGNADGFQMSLRFIQPLHLPENNGMCIIQSQSLFSAWCTCCL